MRVAQSSGGIAPIETPRQGGLFDLLKGRDPGARSGAGGLFGLIDRNAPIESGFGENGPAKLTDLTVGEGKHGFKDRGDDIAANGVWNTYQTAIVNNDKLSNAQKARWARAYAHNFKVKGWGHLQLQAEHDAEEFEAAAKEDRARERIERERDEELIDASEREHSPDRIPDGDPPA